MHILHIAPEKHLSRELMRHQFVEYVCGDLFTEGYSYPDHVRNMNVLDLPFADGHFDLVICNHVLEHVTDDRSAMREILRVLKPGGRAVLQVPISANSAVTHEDGTLSDPGERERLFGQPDHVRIYGQDYVERLSAVGFHVDRINISRKFRRSGLDPREDLFICRKP
jgi:SAM-dependent methyltransferase